MKTDLLMWVRDGAKTLDGVLSSIETSIPEEYIGKKVVIDDKSMDGSRAIARRHGWVVYINTLKGIANGANQALSYVDSEFFCSFEQDVILAEDWWSKVSPIIEVDKKIACVQGIRFSTNTLVRQLEEFKYPKKIDSSLDNNIFRTSIIRELGGFPRKCPICVDVNLKGKIEAYGYRWVFAEDAVSRHVRSSFFNFLSGQKKWFRFCTHQRYCEQWSSIPKMLRLFLTSPIRGLHLVVKKRNIQFLWSYPFLRLWLLFQRVKFREQIRVNLHE